MSLAELASATELEAKRCANYEKSQLETSRTENQDEWSDSKALRWLQKKNEEFESIYGEVGEFSRSSLHFAALEGPYHLVAYLITRDISVERKDSLGKISLHLACEADRKDNARLLIAHVVSTGNDSNIIDCRDKQMRTPIMIASYFGHFWTLSTFFESYTHKNLKPKVDLWQKDIKGRTALHLAAENGHLKCIDLLLSSMDDKRSYLLEKDKQGMTAIDLSKSHRAAREMLKKKLNSLKEEKDSAFWLTVLAVGFLLVGLVSGIISSAFLGDD